MPHKLKSPLYALHVVDETDMSGTASTAGKKMLEMAAKHAAATDSTIVPLTRFDLNISNGIIYTIKEHKITDIIMGVHHGESLFGDVAEKILQHTNETIFVYKSVQPVNTLKSIVVLVSPNAEYEQGFLHWFGRLQTMSKETGLPLKIYAHEETIKVLKEANAESSSPLSIFFEAFDNWDDFLIFTREVKQDDLFIVISSRKGYLSYTPAVERLPKYLVKYFADTSYIILYPEQTKADPDANFPKDEGIELLDKAGSYVKKIFTVTDKSSSKKS